MECKIKLIWQEHRTNLSNNGGPQLRKPFPRLLIPHRNAQRLLAAYNNHQLLPPGNARIQQVAVQHHIMRGMQGQHHAGALAALVFVDGHRVPLRTLAR